VSVVAVAGGAAVATYLLDSGYHIRTSRNSWVNSDVQTTMIYIHVLNRGGHVVGRPADALCRVRHPSTLRRWRVLLPIRICVT
jgi:hypothetical protein